MTLTREDRIAKAQQRIVRKAVSTACRIGGWWGIPPTTAAEALVGAAAALQEGVKSGSIPWPTESERGVSNGTPDNVILARLDQIMADRDNLPDHAIVMLLRRGGVRRRHCETLSIIRNWRQRNQHHMTRM